jgi:hypothetical protein
MSSDSKYEHLHTNNVTYADLVNMKPDGTLCN